jgi:allophanate hydrolase subunit 2
VSLAILKAGIGTSLRDLGRWGLAAQGLAPSGVMDVFSFRLLNVLLKNSPAEAALEISDATARFVFGADCRFGLAGADFNAFLNNKPLYTNATYQAKPGEELFFAKRSYGNFLYLGVSGGYDVPIYKGNKGFHTGLGYMPTIKTLPYTPSDGATFIASRAYALKRLPEICIVPNGHTNLNTAKIDPQSNRHAFVLNGHVDHQNPALLSFPVSMGAIQLPPGGKPLVLMADHQTIGGYPLAGYISAASLSDFAQYTFGQSIVFKAITIEIAEQAALAQEKSLDTLKASLAYN